MTQSNQIAVFDIDGVIIRNPHDSDGKGTIKDPNYWHKHWSNPNLQLLQWDMINMAHSLRRDGVLIVFLTARPETYLDSTKVVLKAAGFELDDPLTELIMLPGTAIGHSSAAWKIEEILGLQARGIVLFMVEDYKHNADAIRTVCPVLLYERQYVKPEFVGLYSGAALNHAAKQTALASRD